MHFESLTSQKSALMLLHGVLVGKAWESWPGRKGRSFMLMWWAHIRGNRTRRVIKVLKGAASLQDMTTQPRVIKSAIRRHLQVHYLTISGVGTIAVATETAGFFSEGGGLFGNFKKMAACNYTAALFYVPPVLPKARLYVPLRKIHYWASKRTSITPCFSIRSALARSLDERFDE